MTKVIEAVKNIYPDIKGGFVYWETKYDGSSWDNPEDGLVWDNSEYNKPNWSDIETQLSNIVLDDAKASKVKEIIGSVSKYLYEPISFNGNSFVNSEISGNNLQAAYTFMDEPIEWLDVNGDAISMSKEQIKQLIGLILTHRKDVYYKEAAIKKAITTCTRS